MSDVTINYKGSSIATMDASGAKTLLTDGKYCEDDIEVVYVKPSVSPNLQAKTNVSATTSSQTITADEGYDGLSSVQINALDGQAAQTIHPSTSDQTIASGKYLTGAQTVKGVLLTNLSAGNIKKDVVVKIGDSTDDDCVTSVTGTYEGGVASQEDAILERTLSGSYYNDRITKIGGALLRNEGLVEVNFPNLEYGVTGSNEIFRYCSNLERIYIPKFRTGASNCNYAFADTKLQSLALPAYSGALGNRVFSGCSSFTAFDVGPSCTGLGNDMFYNCSSFTTLILRRTDGLVSVSNSTFNTTPFKSGGTGGTIYIPKALYDHLGDGTSLDYKAATNWSTYQGYGTITWAKIEDSIYATQYADGTTIPT